MKWVNYMIRRFLSLSLCYPPPKPSASLLCFPETSIASISRSDMLTHYLYQFSFRWKGIIREILLRRSSSTSWKISANRSGDQVFSTFVSYRGHLPSPLDIREALLSAIPNFLLRPFFVPYWMENEFIDKVFSKKSLQIRIWIAFFLLCLFYSIHEAL